MIIEPKLFKSDYDEITRGYCNEVDLEQFFLVSKRYIEKHSSLQKYSLKTLKPFCLHLGVTSLNINSAKTMLELYTLSIDLNVPLIIKNEEVEISQWRKELQKTLLKNIDSMKKDIQAQQTEILKVEEEQKEKENKLLFELANLKEKNEYELKEVNSLIAQNNELKSTEASLELQYLKSLSDKEIITNEIKKMEATHQKRRENYTSLEEKEEALEYKCSNLENKIKQLATKIQEADNEKQKLLKESSELSKYSSLEEIQRKIELMKADNKVLEEDFLEMVEKKAATNYNTDSIGSSCSHTFNLNDELQNLK